MSSLSVKSQTTFLSMDVENLLHIASSEVDSIHNTERNWLKGPFEINWERIEKSLASIRNIYGSKSWFSQAIEVLIPLINLCDERLKNITFEDYDTHLQPYLKWTSQKEVVHTCVNLVSCESNDADHLLALLLITSVAERALGNLLLSSQKQVPFLLRDLLAAPNLEKILGKPKIQILVVLFGSVLGLNLRNIAWHGFLSPKEARSSYVALIIFLLADCGRTIKIMPCCKENIPKRPYTTFKEFECPPSFQDEQSLPTKAMEEILAKSPLVPDIMLPAWDKALYLLEGEKYGLCLTLLFPLLECSLRCLYAQVNNMFERVITAENSSYYTTIDEILQLYLENDNACSKSRLSKCHENEDDEHLANASSQSELLFKSEKSRLKTSGRAYLTFNLVPFYIGRHINEMLHDMLNYVNGPRIRDRLSHGEVDVFDVPKWMTHSMMYVSCLLLCLGNWKKKREIYTEKQYLLQKRCLTNISTSLEANDHPVSQFCPEMVSAMNNTENAELYDAKFLNYLNIINLSSDATTFINKAKKYIRNYRCAYHPSALLLGKLISCLHKLKKWTSWDRTCSDDLSYTHWENISFMKLPEILTYCCDAPYHKVILLNDIQEFIHSVECTSCDVLYKPKCELELLSLLSRILHNTELALTNIKENLTLKYFQYKSNKLRSRQRETYTRQLNSVPVIVLNLYISCQCVYSVFISVNHILQSDAPTLSRLLKVFKQILKQIENTVSQTSAKCNRWDEAFISSENNIQYITNIFGKRNEDICP